MRILFSTPVKMVGSMNQPLPHSGRVAGVPPSCNSQPSSLAMSMYFSTFSYCGGVVTGPTSVLMSIGFPIFALFANSTTRRTKSSWMERCTSSREPAMQVCPVAAKMPEIAPLTALSRLASSKTMLGDLPPSSRLTFLRPAAAAW